MSNRHEGFPSHIDRNIAKKQNQSYYKEFNNNCPRFNDSNRKCNGFGGYCNKTRKECCTYFKEYFHTKELEKSLLPSKVVKQSKVIKNTVPENKRIKYQNVEDIITEFMFTLTSIELSLIRKQLQETNSFTFKTVYIINQIDRPISPNIIVTFKNGKNKYLCKFNTSSSKIDINDKTCIFELHLSKIEITKKQFALYSTFIASGKRDNLNNGRIFMHWN